MTSGYNTKMRESDAKYKVYIHQDVYILNPNFLITIINLFLKYPKLGMIGVFGVKTLPESGIWWEGNNGYGMVYANDGKDELVLQGHKVNMDYEKVQAIDGLIMITQYDIEWREDLFRGWHFYDISQSLEFIKAGFEVGIPRQETPWCFHDHGIVSLKGYEENRKIFIENYRNIIKNVEADEMDWKYYNPAFDSNNYNPSINSTSAWSGHLNFGYDLVRFLKPNLVVELGTYHGASFFSFCQAVKDGMLSTKCFAIDNWEGDIHVGSYSKQVFHTVKEVADLYYPNIATLVRSTFDDALNTFQDNTIDILHIDGCHTFEAVTHDFLTWSPKLAENGVILFHDIVVLNEGFGVHRLWTILKRKFPSIQFEHSFGLGVLFPKGYNEDFIKIFDRVEELQNVYKR